MRKFFTAAALLLAGLTAAHAQVGIVGGFTSSTTSINKEDIQETLSNVNLFHAGIAYKIESGSLFVLQPAVTYQMKGANITSDTNGSDFIKSLETKTGFAELSLGLQVGLDLLAFRPYVFAEPFVGYALNGTECLNDFSEDTNLALENVKNKLEYGFGVGAGVELLDHVQLSVQWFKNLGFLYNGDKIDTDATLSAVGESIYDIKDIQSYSGLKVSLGIFF